LAYANISVVKKQIHIEFLKSLQNYYLDEQNRLFIHAGFTNINGIRYELDNFEPISYKISQNSIAWVDQNQRLHLFTNGKSTVATTELFSSYDLNNNILSFNSPENITAIYYQGKIYR
jgi:hypothetical protein